ncbi:isomerase [Elizabethkingia anophelis]|nr:isomerase [Elizabethkingia anophelis]MCT3951274.1 isomerase [Elizabethkingia anophelis]MCT3954817.1 isomerase [Elizabethkingia anophelis]MCT3986757.1 isomerase [Elizabethkingia anophelis]MCT4064940.1 isomerase [Elizabethkingia anophelis]
MSTKIQKMIHNYLEAWNQKNQNDFKKAFSKVLSENLKYTDPTFDVTGVDAIVNMALNSLEKFPGRKFEMLTEPEFHHNVGRYNWRMIFADGTFQNGFDCFEFNEDFFITRIIAFF